MALYIFSTKPFAFYYVIKHIRNTIEHQQNGGNLETSITILHHDAIVCNSSMYSISRGISTE